MPIKVGDEVNVPDDSMNSALRRLNPVRVMAIAEGYAMLRFKGCMPFIETVKDLEQWNSREKKS